MVRIKNPYAKRSTVSRPPQRVFIFDAEGNPADGYGNALPKRPRYKRKPKSKPKPNLLNLYNYVYDNRVLRGKYQDVMDRIKCKKIPANKAVGETMNLKTLHYCYYILKWRPGMLDTVKVSMTDPRVPKIEVSK